MEGRFLAYTFTLAFLISLPFAHKDLLRQAAQRLREYRDAIFNK